MTKKSAKRTPSDDRLNTEFWREQKRKTLIESTGASMRLSGLKITNEEVEKIISSKDVEDTHPGEYLLIFVAEFWDGQDPKYDNWTAGRMEVRTYDEQYAIEEKRFCTPKSEEWFKFMKQYDGKWVDKIILEQIKETLKEKFYRVDENHNPIL